MIPKFNKNGYLPAGIHKASVGEIKKRFGTNPAPRKELFNNFLAIVRLLQKQREWIKNFFLDGSFVTSKESPGDFDCILIIKDSFDFLSPEAKQLINSKKLYNCHLLIVMENDSSECKKMIAFFGHDREEKPKGLLEVLL